MPHDEAPEHEEGVCCGYGGDAGDGQPAKVLDLLPKKSSLQACCQASMDLDPRLCNVHHHMLDQSRETRSRVMFKFELT